MSLFASLGQGDIWSLSGISFVRYYFVEKMIPLSIVFFLFLIRLLFFTLPAPSMIYWTKELSP
jgi:hypothetical protein